MVLNWILAVVVALVLWSFIEKRLLKITKYRIPADSSESAPGDLKLVVLADLHNNSFGKRNAVLVARIRELNPDVIIIAGDLITKQQPSIPGNAFDLLEELVKDYPIYYGYGNHERHLSELMEETKETGNHNVKHKVLYESFLEFKRVLTDKGVHFLVDESILIKKGGSAIRITGLNADKECYNRTELFPMDRAYLDEHIGKSDPKEYQILIAHHPIFFEAYADWGADLTLAGHLHGGLVRLPHLGGIISPQYNFFPTYDSGVFTANNRRMIVSKGLGSHSFMLRLFNRPELVFIHIEKKAAGNNETKER